VLFCCCIVAVGLLLGVLLVLLIKPPAGFSKHVVVMTGLGEHGDSRRHGPALAAEAAAAAALATMDACAVAGEHSLSTEVA
jgi:hypothetical protein